jgi:hypothetical protein
MYEYASADWRCVSYTKASGAAVVAGGGFTLGTEIATTSGTSHTFTGIPSGTTMIVITFEGTSLGSTADMDVTIGDSGGLETSGYLGGGVRDSTVVNSTGEFLINCGSDADDLLHGHMILALKDSSNFTWTETHIFINATNTTPHFGSGSKSLSAELTQVSISGGTFDAGSVNIMYI